MCQSVWWRTGMHLYIHSLSPCLRSLWRMVAVHTNLCALHKVARPQCAVSLIQRIATQLRTFASMQSHVGERRSSKLLTMQEMWMKYAPRLFQIIYEMDQSPLHLRERARGTSCTLTISIHARKQSKFQGFRYARFDDWAVLYSGLRLCVGYLKAFGCFLLSRTGDSSH